MFLWLKHLISFFSNKDTNERYKFQHDNPTISKLVKPSDGFHTADRQNTDNNYTVRRQNDDRYTSNSQGNGNYHYESIRRAGNNQYDIQRLPGADNRQETDRRNNNFEYTRRIPTADVLVDPIRRPAHGNTRTCVMEINIAVSLGGDRSPRVSFESSDITSKPPPIRSTAVLEDVSYVDLKFQGPEKTAQLSTDAYMTRSPSQKSSGFNNDKNN